MSKYNPRNRQTKSDGKQIASWGDSFTYDGMVNLLKTSMEQVPVELRHTVTFEIDKENDPYSDGKYPRLFMYWMRFETDEEFSARTAILDANEAATVNHELKELARLKAKYEK